jgi:inorganic pyrophosphatase
VAGHRLAARGAQHAAQDEREQDRIVQLPDDGEDVGDEVERRGEVEPDQEEERPPPATDHRVTREAAGEHEAVGHEAPERPRVLPPAGQRETADGEEPQHDHAQEADEPPAQLRFLPVAHSINVYVEIPKGSRNKYEWDEELGALKLDRFLFSSLVYPTDYGMIPETMAEDGDPLDAMVCLTEPTFPGCLIPAKVIALFSMRDDKGQDDKVVCVPYDDPNWNHMETLDDIPQPLRDEISHFFSVYKTPEGKVVKVDGWHEKEKALEVIEDARRRHAEEGPADDRTTESGERESAGDPKATEAAGPT